jgi:hypothetical protein
MDMIKDMDIHGWTRTWTDGQGHEHRMGMDMDMGHEHGQF